MTTKPEYIDTQRQKQTDPRKHSNLGTKKDKRGQKRIAIASHVLNGQSIALTARSSTGPPSPQNGLARSARPPTRRRENRAGQWPPSVTRHYGTVEGGTSETPESRPPSTVRQSEIWFPAGAYTAVYLSQSYCTFVLLFGISHS